MMICAIKRRAGSADAVGIMIDGDTMPEAIVTDFGVFRYDDIDANGTPVYIGMTVQYCGQDRVVTAIPPDFEFPAHAG